MGTVRALPASARGVQLADAVTTFLDTISVTNTFRGYAIPLDRMARDFGADANVAVLDPDRVASWFTFVWGGSSPKTFNTRLTAIGSACTYWREQEWLFGDPLVRLRTRPTPPDRSRALIQPQVASILALDAPLRERVLWAVLYESAARAEEVLLLDVTDLDPANRRAVVVRKGGARDVIVWQTGTARLLPRLLNGRRSGPVFLTDRKARPSVALADVDPITGRARLSYRRAAELFERHTTKLPGGPFTLHQLRHSALGAHPRRRGRRVHAHVDGAVWAHLGALIGQIRPRLGRGPRQVASRA